MGELPGYRFPRRDERGVLAGLRGGQLAALGLGLMVAVGALTAMPSGLGALVALSSAALGGAIAFVPVAGATVEVWLPVALRWAARSVSGRAVRLASVPVSAPRANQDGRPLLAGCHVVALPVGAGGQRVGVLHDRHHEVASAVLEVQPLEFLLLGASDQDRAATSWASCLAALAAIGPLRRLQWLSHSGPRPEEDGHGVGPGGPVTESGQLTLRRQRSYVAVSVDAPGAVGRLPKPSVDWLDALDQVLAATDAELRRTGLPVLGPLSPVAAAGLLADLTGTRHGGPPWPLAVTDAWDHVRCDGARHAVYWVAEWPHLEVRPEFLVPLLGAERGRRTVAMTLEAVPTERATRQVEAARTSEVADSERRRRSGILLTARRRLEQEGLAAREADLAHGHASFRINGFVAVCAPTADELEADCQETQQAAARAHLALRRLYGRQAEALTWVLPLARGLA